MVVRLVAVVVVFLVSSIAQSQEANPQDTDQSLEKTTSSVLRDDSKESIEALQRTVFQQQRSRDYVRPPGVSEENYRRMLINRPYILETAEGRKLHFDSRHEYRGDSFQGRFHHSTGVGAGLAQDKDLNSMVVSGRSHDLMWVFPDAVLTTDAEIGLRSRHRAGERSNAAVLDFALDGKRMLGEPVQAGEYESAPYLQIRDRVKIETGNLGHADAGHFEAEFGYGVGGGWMTKKRDTGEFLAIGACLDALYRDHEISDLGDQWDLRLTAHVQAACRGMGGSFQLVAEGGVYLDERDSGEGNEYLAVGPKYVNEFVSVFAGYRDDDRGLGSDDGLSVLFTPNLSNIFGFGNTDPYAEIGN